MKAAKVTIEPATKEDAPLLAKVVGMAVGEEKVRKSSGAFFTAILEELAQREDSPYSFRHALVARVDGKSAGGIIGYDGDALPRLRLATQEVIRKHTGKEPRLDWETEGGEFYLDSVSVLPEFRGLGIGKKLVLALCEKAYQEGHACVGLLVEPENKGADALYRALGFEEVGRRRFLGSDMYHLQRKKPQA